VETGGGAATTAAPPPVRDGVLTIQRLEVRPGEEDEFLRRFQEIDVLGLAADAAEGSLLEATLAQDEQTFVVVTTWSSPEGIERWIASPARERVRAELESLYAEPPTVSRYAIRTRFPAGTDGGA
jgi:heme-degrading monooxygenase HmoA